MGVGEQPKFIWENTMVIPSVEISVSLLLCKKSL